MLSVVSSATTVIYDRNLFITSAQKWIEAAAADEENIFYAVVDLQSGKAVGVCALACSNPDMGNIEIGHLEPIL
jgi:hypothetical protein